MLGAEKTQIIHALPGMGADHRMYPTPWSSIPHFVAHDWMRHSGETTLADVARSMCTAHNIRDGDILIGSSLGGMVACEITKLRRIPKLYLVGSAIRKEEVSKLLKALHPLAKVAPLEWIQVSAGKCANELAQMFSDAEPSFVRMMCEAVFKWDGLGETKTKVFRIHGKDDFVIPPPRAVDLLLNAGHLISMTHANECAEAINADLASIDAN